MGWLDGLHGTDKKYWAFQKEAKACIDKALAAKKVS